MLNLKFIRENPDKVKKGCEQKQAKVDIDRLLKLDEKRKKFLKMVEDLRSKKNKLGKDEIKQAQKIRTLPPERTLNASRILKTQIKKIEPELEKIENELSFLEVQIPNLPLPGVPIGKDETDNKVLEKIGKKPKFDFKPKDYLEIAENLDLIDVKRAAKVSGTRFGFIKREAVLLEFALINFVFNKLHEKGFIPIIPPIMLKREMAQGMGYLEQADKNEAYYFPQDDLFLAGTSEQPIGAMHSGEVLDEKDLPRRYLGFSTCFRRESGSYGKDTKGILRVHQFDKMEMFSFSKPEDSEKEHQLFFEIEKDLMKDLKLPFQTIHICTGDLGFPAAAKYDIETWVPSENRYRETHSTSNCTDFQARRLNIRFKNKAGKLEFVHTINGTAFAIGRILIAIIENYQQKDGSVKVPEVLQKYLKFKLIK